MIEQREQVKFYEDRYYQDRSNLKHNLSFAGCGFLGLYHVGVCCCIKKLAPHLYQNKRLSGTSAGAIAAVCLVCDVNIAECVQYMYELIKNARRHLLGPFDPRFRITEHLREGLNRILPSDAHVLCSGRLSISLTCYATHKNIVVNQFRDKDELINAVLCSAYIPIFSGFVPPTFRGQSVLDGGLSDNLLCIDKMTIRVSPFAGDADICPLDAPWDSRYLASAPQHVEDVIGSISFLNNNIRLNRTNIRRLIHMVWPMSSDELASLACQGYEDARRYLITRGFISCRLHQNLLSPISTSHGRRSSGPIAASAGALRRRNMSMYNLIPESSGFPKKRRQSTTNIPTPDNAVNPLHQPRTARSTTPHSLSCGLGWNVPDCGACQEELRKATRSSMPAFLVSIIKGDSERQLHARGGTFSLPSVRLLGQGWGLAQELVRSGASSLYWLGCRMFYLPLLIQLDLLIRIATVSAKLCDPCNQCVSNTRRFVDALIRIRNRVTSWDVSQSVQLFDDHSSYNNSGGVALRPNTRFVYPTERAPSVHHSASFESADLTSRLRSVILAGTNRLADQLCLYQLGVPDAAECGLELFSSPTVPLSRQLSVSSMDQSSSSRRFFLPSDSRFVTPESGASNEEGNGKEWPSNNIRSLFSPTPGIPTSVGYFFDSVSGTDTYPENST